MLYGLPISDIQFSDIEAFCIEDREEGVILDYKSIWPKELEKTMAAMANTSGGIILVGVGERSGTRKPELPLKGVDIDKGVDDLQQKVVSTAYRGIYPPLFPEVRVCELPTDSSKAIVLIRIHESNMTPHATHGRTRIYVRVDSQSEPETLARIDQLQWLFDKRKATIEHRNNIVQSAWDRGVFELGQVESRSPSQRSPTEAMNSLLNHHQGHVELVIYTVPLFPDKVIQPITSLIEPTKRPKPTSNHIKDSNKWFPSAKALFRTVPSGLRALDPLHEPQYAELNEYGLLFMLQHLPVRPYPENVAAWEGSSQQGLPPVLAPHKIIGCLDALLFYSAEFYANAGFQGLIRLFVRLEDVQKVYLKLDEWEPPDLISLDDNLDLLQEDILAREILNRRVELLKLAFSRLVWSFGYPWTETLIDRWIDKYVKPI